MLRRALRMLRPPKPAPDWSSAPRATADSSAGRRTLSFVPRFSRTHQSVLKQIVTANDVPLPPGVCKMVDPKPKSIPHWQRGRLSQVSPSTAVDSDTNANSEVGNDHRKELLELASEWLKHEDIKDESTDQKISFLQKKGLTKEETHELLGLSLEVDSSENIKTEEETQFTVRSQYKLTETSGLTDYRQLYRLRPPFQPLNPRHRQQLS